MKKTPRKDYVKELLAASPRQRTPHSRKSEKRVRALFLYVHLADHKKLFVSAYPPYNKNTSRKKLFLKQIVSYNFFLNHLSHKFQLFLITVSLVQIVSKHNSLSSPLIMKNFGKNLFWLQIHRKILIVYKKKQPPFTLFEDHVRGNKLFLRLASCL